MSRRLKPLAAIFGLLFSISPGAWAQWTTQTITLNPGWNAVYLEVQPEPQDCDQVFAGLPVESAWRWNRRFSTVQFVQDPAALTPSAPDWLVYLPATHALAESRSLHAIEGGRPYLIQIRSDAGSVVWRLQGRVVPRRTEWLTDSLNFVGFPAVPPAPSFARFFGGSDSHRNGPVFRLSTTGYWTEIPTTTVMQPAEAFWIRTLGQSDYPGPVAVRLEQSTGLNFGSVLQEQTLRVQNRSSQTLNITLVQQASEQPNSPEAAALAGPVPLSYWSQGATVQSAGWRPLLGTLTLSNVPAGGTRSLRLAVRRADMTPFAGGNGAMYQSILEVKDTAGLSRQLIPVTSRGPSTLAGAGLFAAAGMSQTGQPRPGLWIGHAVIDRVSEVASANPNDPKPTACPFQFRLILHCNERGDVRLLQKVVQMWKPGTYQPDPNDPTQRVVDQPGRFVLITDDARLGDYSGATLRDGVPAGRRFSTAAFGFRDPILMTAQGAARWQCRVDLGYDAPLNPFKHLYHPEHDNRNPTFDGTLGPGRESFDVSRTISVEFTATDPENLSVAGWGDNQIGGIYREEISGLNRQPLIIQGRFRLQLASRETRLNDQP